MIATYRTVRMTGSGEIRCRGCNSEARRVAAGAMITIVRITKVTRIVNHEPFAVIHDCGDRYQWTCPHCDSDEFLVGERRRSTTKRWMCRRCTTAAVLVPVAQTGLN